MSNQEQLLAPLTITLYGKAVEGIGLDADKLGRQLKAYLERSGETELRLANIYGFRHEGRYFLLPAATIFVVAGTGSTTNRDDFPETYEHWHRYNAWTADRQDPSIRFELETGTLEQLLLEPSEGGGEDDYGPGTLIRGADGRMYFIPGDLETYEVLDEEERSELALTQGADRSDLTVSSTGFRGRATFRGRASFRGRAGFRGRATFRGRMTAPNRCR